MENFAECRLQRQKFVREHSEPISLEQKAVAESADRAAYLFASIANGYLGKTQLARPALQNETCSKFLKTTPANLESDEVQYGQLT